MNKEIEARFLEIDKEKIIDTLRNVSAKDLGEEMLSEIIFYDKDLRWKDDTGELVKLRKNSKKITLTYKKRHEVAIDGMEEIEVEVSDFDNTKAILEKSGLVAYRQQEKKRHTFVYEDIVFDIDTWPKIPTYIEIEAPTEEKVRKGASLIGLPWENAVFEGPRTVIENVYKIPVGSFRYFTFSKTE